MFTGIIEATATVRSYGSGRLMIDRPPTFNDLKIGDSVAVSGVCLTVVLLTGDTMAFDVVPETLKKTKLGSFRAGDRVNLERAMRSEDRLHGHIVQGHVEGIGMILSPTPPEEGLEVEATAEDLMVEIKIEVPADLLPFILKTGSITIDGVSLTVADIERTIVTIALIPHTINESTLGSLKKGDHVNIETDVLAKYAAKQIVSGA